MKVTLLNSTPLWVAQKAIRTAWDSHDKSDSKEDVWACKDCGTTFDYKPINDSSVVCCSNCNSINVGYFHYFVGTKDKELIERVGNKYKHASTLEHIVFTFDINGISRACLQELCRHRIASLTVRSTRYVLKQLKTVEIDATNIEEFCVFPEFVDKRVAMSFKLSSVDALASVQRALVNGISNDKAKYLLPENFKTDLVWTINMRSLQNFLSLRTDKSALWEIRELANKVFEAVPEEYKYLLEDFVKNK
jgi:thymidylate synthase (FAD)